MPVQLEAAMQQAGQPPSTSQHPKLRRLAAKPIRLAASTFNRSLSRSASSGPTAAPIPSQTPSLSDLSLSDQLKTGKKGRRKRLPALGPGHVLTPAQIIIAARGPRKPLDGEEPAAWVRVRVVRSDGLVAKDKRGTSDPFVTVLLPPSSRHATPVVKRTLNPSFPASSSTFDYPLYLSLAMVVGARGIECVVWDKDLMRKEYMGEVTIPLTDWFPQGEVQLWNDSLPLLSPKLLSTRRRHKVTGTASFQIGLLQPKGVKDPDEAVAKLQRVFRAFLEQGMAGRLGIAGVLSVPAHEGIGTIKMKGRSPFGDTAPPSDIVPDKSTFALFHSTAAATLSPIAGHQAEGAPDLDEGNDSDEDMPKDDGISSSSEGEFEDALSEDPEMLETPSGTDLAEDNCDRVPALPVPSKMTALSPPKVTSTPSRQASLPGYFDRPKRHSTVDSGNVSPGETPGVMTPGGSTTKTPIFKRTKSQKHPKPATRSSTKDFNFNAGHAKDVLGIVIMEIKSAQDLPRIKNSLRIGFDMDPFVVISFGKKVFRTRVIRHHLNPIWDEKLVFHVRRHESAFTVQLAVLDWDKVSGNDMVGTATLPLSDLDQNAPRPDPVTGLYAREVDGRTDMREFTLSLTTDHGVAGESKHPSKLTVRAKYEPYDAVRQRFWRQYIAQYDIDNTGTMSYTELTAMLDSLGSTLTTRTIESYFKTFGKHYDSDELSIDEVIRCLEREITKSPHEKEKVDLKSQNLVSSGMDSGSVTPSVQAQPNLDGLYTTGPEGGMSDPVDPAELAEYIRNSDPRRQQDRQDSMPGNMEVYHAPTDLVHHPSYDSTAPAVRLDRKASVEAIALEGEAQSGLMTPKSGVSDTEMDDALAEFEGRPAPSTAGNRERIINIRSCPLCHRRRLGRKSEQDIVTHLAICASSNWSRVDRIVTANYVTSSQAQRKFFTRMINKVAIGTYSLGANSANILVQDRVTGQLQEEKMAVYVRLGIRVLYKGAKSKMEGGRARRLLKSMSVKQGMKYDSPASALDIPAFITFHRLDVSEIRDPIDSFKTFNEFFYRKIKPEARPVSDPGDDGRLVSCSDCRMVAFESINEATRLWIKGREFTVGRLLGPQYDDVVDRFEGGAVGIFRLAPQDYHRFHSPVKGRVGKMTMIDGEYYTVNPQAIRTTLDVYGENVRKVVPIETEEFGLVMTVWVGAMMVGSILTTVEEGQMVERADEIGYFAFGGSTIVCVFEKDSVQWDADLLQNGQATIETLVKMGMGIGRSTRVAPKKVEGRYEL